MLTRHKYLLLSNRTRELAKWHFGKIKLQRRLDYRLAELRSDRNPIVVANKRLARALPISPYDKIVKILLKLTSGTHLQLIYSHKVIARPSITLFAALMLI